MAQSTSNQKFSIYLAKQINPVENCICLCKSDWSVYARQLPNDKLITSVELSSDENRYSMASERKHTNTTQSRSMATPDAIPHSLSMAPANIKAKNQGCRRIDDPSVEGTVYA